MATGKSMDPADLPPDLSNLSKLAGDLRGNANQAQTAVPPPAEPGPSRSFTREPDPEITIDPKDYYSTLGHAMEISAPSDTSTKSYLKQLDALIPLSYSAAYHAHQAFQDAHNSYEEAVKERQDAQKALQDAEKALQEKEGLFTALEGEEEDEEEELFQVESPEQPGEETLLEVGDDLEPALTPSPATKAPEAKGKPKAKSKDKAAQQQLQKEVDQLKAKVENAKQALKAADDAFTTPDANGVNMEERKNQALAQSEAMTKYHEFLVTLRAQANNHNAYVDEVFKARIEAIQNEYLKARGSIIRPEDRVFFQQLEAMRKMHTAEFKSVYGIQLFGERKSPCQPGSNSIAVNNSSEFRKKGQVRVTDDNGVVTGAFDYNVNFMIGAAQWGVSRGAVRAKFEQQVADFVTIALNDYPGKGTALNPIHIAYDPPGPPDQRPELGLAILLEFKQRACEMGKPLFVMHEGKTVEITPEQGFSQSEADMFIAQANKPLYRQDIDGNFEPDQGNRKAALIVTQIKIPTTGNSAEDAKSMQQALLQTLNKKIAQKPSNAQLAPARELLTQARLQQIDKEPLHRSNKR